MLAAPDASRTYWTEALWDTDRVGQLAYVCCVRVLFALAVVYVLLSSSVVWLWWAGSDGWGAVLGSNTYVWICLGLLLAVPLSTQAARANEPAAALD